MIDSPDVRLHKTAELFKSRNKDYGSTYIDHGELVALLFKATPVDLSNPIDASRFAAFSTIVSKLVRYAKNWNKGGHADSLDDISVYCQMIRELDDMKERG